MAFSKIILNGTTLIDLTADTVATTNLIAPNTAHNNAGEAIVGTASAGVDGDDLAYGVGGAVVGTALVGSAVAV